MNKRSWKILSILLITCIGIVLISSSTVRAQGTTTTTEPPRFSDWYTRQTQTDWMGGTLQYGQFGPDPGFVGLQGQSYQYSNPALGIFINYQTSQPASGGGFPMGVVMPGTSGALGAAMYGPFNTPGGVPYPVMPTPGFSTGSQEFGSLLGPTGNMNWGMPGLIAAFTMPNMGLVTPSGGGVGAGIPFGGGIMSGAGNWYSGLAGLSMFGMPGFWGVGAGAFGNIGGQSTALPQYIF